MARRSSAQTETCELLPGAGLPLFDRAYFPAVRRLLAGATERIDVAMFYISHSRKRGNKVGELVGELLKARKRGVKVRVLLDRDEEGDPYRSREVNKPVYDLLKRAGARVKWDQSSRVLHSKVVVVDGRAVVVGSHNWTLGSLDKYHDTSMLVESPQLAERYGADFDSAFR